MSALSAKRDGDTVAITVEIGDKRARLRVTREYAKAFARYRKLPPPSPPEPAPVHPLDYEWLARHFGGTGS